MQPFQKFPLATVPRDVKAGERLAAEWLNKLKRSIGRRQLRQNGLPFTGEIVGIIDRFRIEYSDSTNILVYLGKWTRNGTPLTLTVDGGEVFKTVEIGADDTFYITLTLSHSGTLKDPNLIPDTLSVTAETSLPSETELDNIQFVIGKVVRETGAITTHEQWWVGDIDDLGITPDGNTNFPNPGNDPVIKTIRLNPTANVHQDELELQNASSLVDGTGIPEERLRFPMLEKDANGTAELKWWATDGDLTQREVAAGQRSIQLRNSLTPDVLQLWNFDDAGTAGTLLTTDLVLVRSATGPELRYVNGVDFSATYGDAMGDYLNTAGKISHHTLAGLNDGEDDKDHLWAWSNDPTTPDDSTRNYGSSIGRTGPVLAIDLDNMKLHADAGNWTVDWSARQLDGADWSVLNGTILKVLDTTVAAAGDGAVEVAGGIYAGAGIKALRGGAIAAVVGNDGVYEGYLGATFAGVSGSDGTRTAQLADGTNGVTALGNVAITGTSGDYYHNSLQGVTIASRISGGIDVASTHEVQVKFLDDNDYVTVRR